MSPNRRRLLALGLGALLALPLGWLAWARWRPPGGTDLVAFHDPGLDDESWTELLAEPLERVGAEGSLRRKRLPRRVVAKIFRLGESKEYHPDGYYRYVPYWRQRFRWPPEREGGYQVRANGDGLRQDEEILAGQPDLRVLVTGDSHSEGVCKNANTFTKRLEARLRRTRPEQTVECLHAAVGGYSFHNYLGVLERFLELRPDVFVVAVYGGNDFEEVLTLHHLFHDTQRPWGRDVYWDEIEAAKAHDATALAQDFLSLMCFKHFPEQREIALRAALDVTLEIVRQCAENEIVPIVVYIPPARDAQPWLFGDDLPALVETMGLEPQDLAVSDAMADAFLEILGERRIETLDMRPIFAQKEEPMYWRHEWHINPAAHRAIAGALKQIVDAWY